MNTKQALVGMLQAGDTVQVTNHYITVEDHPCYGTRVDTVARVSSSGITFEKGGRVPWPKVADMAGDPEHGYLILGNRPDGKPGVFLEIERT